MIREINSNDYARVSQIWHKESVKFHGWMDNPSKFWGGERRKDFINEIKEESTSLKVVYVEDEHIIGFLTMRKNYILELFVDSKFQRKGIGTALLNLAKKQSDFLTLKVYAKNPTSIKFYIDRDFIVTGLLLEQNTGFCKILMEWKKKSNNQ